MSYKVVELVLDHAPVKDPRALLLLLALAEWSKDDGVTWHGLPAMMRRARCSERHVERLLAGLTAPDEQGRILLFKRSGPVGECGNKDKTFWEINLALLRRLRAEEKGQGNLFKSCAEVVDGHSKTGTGDAGDVAKTATDPSPYKEEPEVEPEIKPGAAALQGGAAAAAVEKLKQELKNRTRWPAGPVQVSDEVLAQRRQQLLRELEIHRTGRKA